MEKNRRREKWNEVVVVTVVGVECGKLCKLASVSKNLSMWWVGHGSLLHSYGTDTWAVMSGNCCPCQKVVEYCKNCVIFLQGTYDIPEYIFEKLVSSAAVLFWPFWTFCWTVQFWTNMCASEVASIRSSWTAYVYVWKDGVEKFCARKK